MTRANDRKQDGSVDKNAPQDGDVTPAEERARVLQARESVQDAIGKIIGEPIGDEPDDDTDTDSGGRGDARKPVSRPVTRKDRIDGDGAD